MRPSLSGAAFPSPTHADYRQQAVADDLFLSYYPFSTAGPRGYPTPVISLITRAIFHLACRICRTHSGSLPGTSAVRIPVDKIASCVPFRVGLSSSDLSTSVPGGERIRNCFSVEIDPEGYRCLWSHAVKLFTSVALRACSGGNMTIIYQYLPLFGP